MGLEQGGPVGGVGVEGVEEGFLDSGWGEGVLAWWWRGWVEGKGRDALLDDVAVSDQYRVDL